MVSAKEILSRMKDDGWNLQEQAVEDILAEKPTSNWNQITQEILNTDLKDIGVSCISEDVQKGKANTVAKELVLQVTKVRNIAAPKANEESGAAPRMLRLSLTDGTNTLQGLEIQHIKGLSLSTAPGTKVKVSSKTPLNSGYLWLTPHNLHVLGGKVQELYDKWKLSTSVAKYGRNVRAADGSGPPLWVPFGKRIVKDKGEVRNFKALKGHGTENKEDNEFESQRRQTVQELAKEGNSKVFGGGKQMLDATVQRVVNAGFSQEVAMWALRQHKNDATKAIKELRAAASGQPPPSRAVVDPYADEDDTRGGRRGRGGGRGRGKKRGGRGGGGPDDSDDDNDPPPNMPRPSGPASLFDFLDTKMAEKKETATFVEPVASVTEGCRDGRGRGGRGRGRGRGHHNNFSSHNNTSQAPPDLTAENWPAPGETTPATPSGMTYIQSRSAMEDHTTTSSNTRNNRSNVSNGGAARNSGGSRGDNRRQGGGYDNYRDTRDSRKEDYGGGKGGYNARGGDSGNYRGRDDYSDRRGGDNRRDGGYDRNYHDSQSNSYSGYYNSGGSGYNNYYSGYDRQDADMSKNNSNHYNSSERYHNNDRNQQGGYGRGGGGGGRGRGGGGRGGGRDSYNQRGSYQGGSRSEREQELIQDFKRSMTMSGHYIMDTGHHYGGYQGPMGNMNNSIDYSGFSGTLEFRRGGGSGGGRRGRGTQQMYQPPPQRYQ